jgi:hypothetical protein
MTAKCIVFLPHEHRRFCGVTRISKFPFFGPQCMLQNKATTLKDTTVVFFLSDLTTKKLIISVSQRRRRMNTTVCKQFTGGRRYVACVFVRSLRLAPPLTPCMCNDRKQHTSGPTGNARYAISDKIKNIPIWLIFIVVM